jgi:hypothetical protein
MINSNDPIGNRTWDFPDCNAMPLPTTPPRNTERVHAILVFFYVAKAVVGLGLFHGIPGSQTQTQHSVGLLWTSDRQIAEI